MATKCYSMSLCCALFLCRTNPHIHEQGGDSAPTFYSSSKLRKSHFFTASPPLGGIGHFCPIAFLSTPAAYRSDQNWTHLPKIGEISLSESLIFGRPFRGGKIRCQLMAENSALLCLERFFSKIGKTVEAIKTEFSVLS